MKTYISVVYATLALFLFISSACQENDIRQEKPAEQTQIVQEKKSLEGTQSQNNNAAFIPGDCPDFASIDTDGDGQLSFEELSASFPNVTQDDIEACGNGGALLSEEDYQACCENGILQQGE